MIKLVTGLLIEISAYASILGLYFTIVPPQGTHSIWHWIGLLVFALLALVSLGRDVIDHIRTRPKVYGGKNKQVKINKYMCRWLSSGGRAVIFSRDLSWAANESLRLILLAKAARGELTLFVEHPLPITDELAKLGATIVVYKDGEHLPRSRFTIIDYGREGARVAVGVTQNGKHVIEEFQSGEHPFFAIAEDLTKFIERYQGALHARDQTTQQVRV